MKKFLAFFFLILALPALACGDDEKEQKVPFAKMDNKLNFENLTYYEIFLPEKYKGFYLTSFNMMVPNSLNVSLDFSEAFGYKGYYSVGFQIKTDLINVLKLYPSYSTREDKQGMVMCGETMQLELQTLLKTKQPEMIIPPPPPPFKNY
jgi:hypothetical protein